MENNNVTESQSGLVKVVTVIMALVVGGLAGFGLSVFYDKNETPEVEDDSRDAYTDLSTDMQAIFSEYSYLLLDYTRSVQNESPDQTALSDELVQNRQDFADLLATYYSEETVNSFSTSLEEQNQTLLAYTNALKSGNTEDADAAVSSLETTNENIATILADANSSINKDELKQEIEEFTTLLTETIKLYSEQKFDESFSSQRVAKFGGIEVGIYLADAIYNEHSESF